MGALSQAESEFDNDQYKTAVFVIFVNIGRSRLGQYYYAFKVSISSSLLNALAQQRTALGLFFTDEGEGRASAVRRPVAHPLLPDVARRRAFPV
jgi:hypothetical protein